jgi:hypothetical protein
MNKMVSNKEGKSGENLSTNHSLLVSRFSRAIEGDKTIHSTFIVRLETSSQSEQTVPTVELL